MNSAPLRSSRTHLEVAGVDAEQVVLIVEAGGGEVGGTGGGRFRRRGGSCWSGGLRRRLRGLSCGLDRQRCTMKQRTSTRMALPSSCWMQHEDWPWNGCRILHHGDIRQIHPSSSTFPSAARVAQTVRVPHLRRVAPKVGHTLNSSSFMAEKNKLYYGDNLEILRDYINDDPSTWSTSTRPSTPARTTTSSSPKKTASAVRSQITPSRTPGSGTSKPSAPTRRVVEQGGRVADASAPSTPSSAASDMMAYLAMMAPAWSNSAASSRTPAPSTSTATPPPATT